MPTHASVTMFEPPDVVRRPPPARRGSGTRRRDRSPASCGGSLQSGRFLPGLVRAWPGSAKARSPPGLRVGPYGALDRIRTCDLLLRRQTRYPLRYEGVCRRMAACVPSACSTYHTRAGAFQARCPSSAGQHHCMLERSTRACRRERRSVEAARTLVVVNPHARHGVTADLLPAVGAADRRRVPARDSSMTADPDDAARIGRDRRGLRRRHRGSAATGPCTRSSTASCADPPRTAPRSASLPTGSGNDYATHPRHIDGPRDGGAAARDGNQTPRSTSASATASTSRTRSRWASTRRSPPRRSRSSSPRAAAACRCTSRRCSTSCSTTSAATASALTFDGRPGRRGGRDARGRDATAPRTAAASASRRRPYPTTGLLDILVIDAAADGTARSGASRS